MGAFSFSGKKNWGVVISSIQTVVKNGRKRWVVHHQNRHHIHRDFLSACGSLWRGYSVYWQHLTYEKRARKDPLKLKKIIWLWLGAQVEAHEKRLISRETLEQYKIQITPALSSPLCEKPSIWLCDADFSVFLANTQRRIKAAFALCASMGICSPLSLRIPKSPQKPLRIPPRSHIKALIEQGNDKRVSVLAHLLSVAGLRIGEALALHAGDIDSGILTVKHQLKESVLAPTKGRKTRQIVIPNSLEIRMLELASENKKGRVFTNIKNSNFVNSRPFSINYFIPVQEAVCGDVYNYHAFRHYAVSRWISEGFTPLEVQRLAGHGDVKTTLVIYAHLFDLVTKEVPDY